jgi:Methyltransferase domain/Nucleotide-diphospho-sugar transferase
MKDVEADRELSSRGREVLRRLNAEVRSSGVPLEGNLFYFDKSSPAVDDPPDAGRYGKRRNFLRTIEGAASLLEIGFNAGHSALLALDSNPALVYAGVDIGSNAYSRPCADVLASAYGARFAIEYRDSRLYLPQLLIERRPGFDVVHVDGGHDAATACADIALALCLVRPGGVVLVDDTNYQPIHAIVRSLVDGGKAALDTFGGTWEGGDNTAIRPLAAAATARPPGKRLVQYAVGAPWEQLLSMTSALHHSYCRQWQAEYFFDDKERPRNKRPHWRKVGLLRESLEAGFDLVMWLDADSVIVNPKVDIFSFAGPDISVCECFNSPVIARHYNTGFLLLRNTALVRDFVREWDEIPDDFVGWADQKAFMRLLESHVRYRNALTILPNAFNWVAVHMEAENPIIRSAHGEPNRPQLVRDWMAAAALG